MTSKKDNKQYWLKTDEPYRFVTSKEFAKAYESIHVGRKITSEVATLNDKVIHYTRYGGQEIGTGIVLDKILLSSLPSNSSDPCPKFSDELTDDGVLASCLDCFLLNIKQWSLEQTA
ncbi:LRAT-like domain-containing protein [Artemisia annua]|uniref:LRAT-like domain-containing protein n=1 Tax=Artemisia annua TaxID=35608 RepID=A0A2U1LCA5_ARTAN|nr:LRAT-like domain-containing protein [Artemisia annua]